MVTDFTETFLSWSLGHKTKQSTLLLSTGMHRDERSVDSLVLCPHDHDRKVSAKSMITLFKRLQRITCQCLLVR